MDRNTILKHSRSIRLNHQILPDFIEIIVEFCNRREKPEYVEGCVQLINTPMIGQECLNFILEEFEKEFHIIRCVKLETKQIIDIW